MEQPIQVIGGGLAGTEAAWQIASAGIPVILWEMRPKHFSGAHHTEHLAELVCSNSFGAMARDRATGLLHEELRQAMKGKYELTYAELEGLPYLEAVCREALRL